MILDSCRETFGFQLRQFLLYFISHLDDVGIRGGGNHYSYRPLAVVEQFVAGGVFIIFLDAGYIAQTQLVGIMSLNQHASDIFYGLELVADSHPDTVIAIGIIPRISGFVLSVQCGEHFGGFHAQVGHPVL